MNKTGYRIKSLFLKALILFLFLGSTGYVAEAQKKSKKKNKGLKKELKKQESEAKNSSDETFFYFSEGLRYSLNEDYLRAASYFEKALETDPNNAAIHFKLGETYTSLQDLDKALVHAKTAVALDNSNEYYYLLLSRIYEFKNDLNSAIKTYKELIANVPGSESNYFDLALLQVMKSDWEGALESFDAIEEEFGPNPDIINQKQKIYLRLNRLDEALEEGRKLIKEYPEELDYVVTLAVLMNSNNKPEDAENLLDSLLKEHPNFSSARLVLFEIYRDQGKDQLAYGQLKTAFNDPSLDIGQKAGLLAGYNKYASDSTEKERALELAIILVEVHPGNDIAYSILADVYLERGEKDEALKNYRESIKINQSTYSVWMNILILNFEESRFDTLVFYSEQMVELYPNNSRVWFLQGLGYYSLQDYEKAKYSLETARKWGSNEEDLLLDIEATLGDTYYNLGEYENSDNSYDAVLEKTPDNDHVLNNYSYFLSLRNENLDKALEMSSRLVEKYPDNSTYLDTHAWVLFQMEKYEEALPYLKKATDNTDSGVIYEHLGDVLFKLGQEDEAISAWNKAKELGGGSESLDKKIENGKWYE